jgi:hypothetical protein
LEPKTSKLKQEQTREPCCVKKKTEIKLITADEIAKCKAEEKCNTTMAVKKKNVLR